MPRHHRRKKNQQQRNNNKNNKQNQAQQKAAAAAAAGKSNENGTITEIPGIQPEEAPIQLSSDDQSHNAKESIAISESTDHRSSQSPISSDTDRPESPKTGSNNSIVAAEDAVPSPEKDCTITDLTSLSSSITVSRSSSESDTTLKDETQSASAEPDREISSNQNKICDITTNNAASNLLICDNASETQQTEQQHDDGGSEAAAISAKAECSGSATPIKHAIVQELITTLYPYRVDSPKPMKPKRSGPLTKSKSLDDDDIMIQEMSDTSSIGDLTDNQPLVSEASESEADTDVTEYCEKLDPRILSIQTLPLDEAVAPIDDEDKVESREFTASSSSIENESESQDSKARRARKRVALESHFLPQFLNPRYLDSIKEENSDASDSIDNRSPILEPMSFTDLEDDVFLDSGETRQSAALKVNVIFPKSNLDFSQKKKHISNLRPPAASVIREESPCLVVETKILDPPEAIEESCTGWTTGTIAESSVAAEVVFIDSASSSSSDLMELDYTDRSASVTSYDYSNEDEVHIETPTIEADEAKSIFGSLETTPTLELEESPANALTNTQEYPRHQPVNCANSRSTNSPNNFFSESSALPSFSERLSSCCITNGQSAVDFASANNSEFAPYTPDFQIGGPCSNNMFETLLSPLINNEGSAPEFGKVIGENNSCATNRSEFVRQDSAGSHCSGQSQNTVINKGPSSQTDLADFDIGPCVSGSSIEFGDTESSNTTTAINSLRQICLEALASMPYGKVVLEELASVAGSLNDLTQKHQEARTKIDEDMPYPLPDMPSIQDLVVPIRMDSPSHVKLMTTPPSKLQSPPPPPIPAPPKMESWLGIPTEEDPSVLVCLSPSQRDYMNNGARKTGTDTTPDSLLDMHRKFIERRGYHELSSQQVDRIHREKLDQVVSSTHLRKSTTPPPPPIPPPPLAHMLCARSESDTITNPLQCDLDGGGGDDVDDQNNHRLLAIIRDSKQSCTSESQTTHRKIEQADKSPPQCAFETINKRSESDQYHQQPLPEAPPRSADQKDNLESTPSASNPSEMSSTLSYNQNNWDPFDFGNSDPRKRFSNIETSSNPSPFCSQLLQTQPKRYSNIETSSFTSKKRIENGNVIFDFCDSDKQKFTTGENKSDLRAKGDRGGDRVIISDINLETPTATAPKQSSAHHEKTFSQLFENRKAEEDQQKSTRNHDHFAYDEFRQRAKESAQRAKSEFFDRKNYLLKDFDELTKMIQDDFFLNDTEAKIKVPTPQLSTSFGQREFNVPIKVESDRNFKGNARTTDHKVKTNSVFKEDDRSKVTTIPIQIEGSREAAPPNSAPNSYSSSTFNHQKDRKLSEKRLSSQNLDEWMRYTNDNLGASSENITKPLQKEVEICIGRRSNIRAPRLSASTSNLSTIDSHDDRIHDRRHYSTSHSTIDTTPISPYVTPHSVRRKSLPKEYHDKQLDYIRLKETELQAEFDKLESDRRRLIEEMDTMRSSNRLQKDLFHHQSCRLPTLSEEEAFRQQMHDEWLNKVAEREERRLHKIIKISGPSDDLAPQVPNRNLKMASSTADIGDEFLKRVQERRSKLCMPSDSDWESGAESHPISQPNNGSDTSPPPIKVFQGESERDFKHLPKHLREFAEITNKILEQHDEEEVHQQSSTTTTSSLIKKDGVWSPDNKTGQTFETNKTEHKISSSSTQIPPTPPPPPIWSPQASPVPGRKEFRPVRFESPVFHRKYTSVKSQDSTPVTPPWSYSDSRPFQSTQSTSCSNLINNQSGGQQQQYRPQPQNLRKSESVGANLTQRSTGASYTETNRPQIPKDQNPGFVRPNEVIYQLKNEYMSEPESENDRPKKMAQLARRKFEGIGPTTKDGMPIVLRSEVKENNQHKWYKRMYNTLHKAKDDDEYVTIRYKTHRGRYPYKSNGYMSEPEPNYDSDYATMKYHTLDRRRIPSTGSYQDERSYGTMPNPVRPSLGSYRNQPGRIEDYTPGRSSVSDKEKKEWWDEVMDIFNGHLEQQKLSSNYTEGYLSRALKEQGYESDSNLVFRKKDESHFAPLSPVEQRQAYRSVQSGGEPPLQGFRKSAPEKPKDGDEIEYYPITPTLTKIRVHSSKSALLPIPQQQQEIICYPITNISRPIDLFAPFPKNVPSFVPISPPAPPCRNSSRTSSALKVVSQYTSSSGRSKKPTDTRHEACFQSNYYRQTSVPTNKIGTITIRTQSKREPIVRSKSAGTVSSSKILSTSVREEKTTSSNARISRRQHSVRVSSVSPIRLATRIPDLRKSSPSPVAFGRSISKERTFAEEKRRVEQTLPLCRKSFTASTNILKDPSLKSPDEVKKAVRSSYGQTVVRSRYAVPRKLLPITTSKSASFVGTVTKKSTSNMEAGRKEEKTMKMSVSLSSKGHESRKDSTRTPIASKSTLHSLRAEEKKTPKKSTKTSSTLSLARTSSTFSVDSTGSRKKQDPKRPVTISRSRDYSAPQTLSGRSMKKKSPPKEVIASRKVHDRVQATQDDRGRIKAELCRDITNSVIDRQGSVRSDNFFQNLFLRDMSPTPSIASSTAYKTTSVQDKARYWNTMSAKSEPSLRRPSVYLSQKKPVSDSKFRIMESKQFHQSRSLSPSYRRSSPKGRHVMDQISKFDSIYHLSEEESEFGDKQPGRMEQLIYKYEQRSSSEPRAKTFLTEIIRPDSPTVIHGRQSFEYSSRSVSPVREVERPPTREIRSPSRRRIQSFRESQKAEAKRIIRASSLSSADDRSRQGFYECKDLSHSTSSLNVIERHGPICKHRTSNRFKELNRFYSNLERVGQLERSTSSTDLRPIRKDGEIIDFDLWKRVRAHEKAEKELNYLVDRLKQDQREKDLLFRPKDVEDVKWNEVADSGLRCKEKSVEDLRESFERKVLDEDFDEVKKMEIESTKDTYKPYWRGSSVVDLASNMVVKYNTQPRVSRKREEPRLFLSNNLISTLSKDQVSKIKSQLSEIYSNSPGPTPKGQCEITEDYVVTVSEPTKKVSSLKVRCNSSISKEDLLGPVLKRKEAQMNAIRSEIISTTSSERRHPLPPRPPPAQSKTFERISRQVTRHDTELSEVEKKRLSLSLSREIQDKVLERRNRTSSPVLLARETRGAIAAENAKKSLPDNAPPKEFYSIEYSQTQGESRDSSLEKFSERKAVRVRQSSFGESESNTSDISKTTVIFKEKQPTDGIMPKIKYFEEKKKEEPPKTIYHAREYSSPDEEEVLKAIEDKMKARESQVHDELLLQHKELSSSASDFKELFGKRGNFPTPPPPPPPDEKHEQNQRIFKAPYRSSSLSLSNASSFETLYRSRSISPISRKYYQAYLNSIKTGDVKKITDKFESLNACSRVNFFELSPLRRIRSDPELNKCVYREGQRNPHKVTIRDHEAGDVSWITHKFELKSNASRGRSRTRKVISPILRMPIRKDDRLMPHIDIISKTALLKHEMTKSRSPAKSPTTGIVHSGEVERIRNKFESPDRASSLLGQMYTSSPDISELKDISSYLTSDWIAHKYSKRRDNARSPICPELGPESEHVRRKVVIRPNSTSPPRTKSLVASILKPYYDIFADQKFDPLIHRPKSRYVPDQQQPDDLWKKIRNGLRKMPAVKFEETDVVPPPPPIKGVPLNYYENGRPESPRRYIEGDVNIHYKSPIRYEYKDAIPEEELARKQADSMKKLYQEERRRKYLQELQDMSNRRHTDNFTPTQKSPISLNRYDDFPTDVTPKSPGSNILPRTIARALYNFQGQTARELTFKKGDVIYIRRQIDKNWFEGEHNAMVGLLPANYVEIITKDGARPPPPRKPLEGQARAKFNFSAQSAIELSLNKGELVTLTRRVDGNWFEGKIANRKGIFPVSYVDVLTDIGGDDCVQVTAGRTSAASKPIGVPASHSLSTTNNTSPTLDQLRTNLNTEFNNLTNGHPANGILRETKSVHKTEVLHVDTNSEPMAYRALYKYRPQNSDELELQEGDVVFVLEICDDGWYVGTSQRTGYFGTFPGNYVERV